ncbi:MAG: hypothetical protein WCO92_00050 [Verrucomicrobiota bacterium]
MKKTTTLILLTLSSLCMKGMSQSTTANRSNVLEEKTGSHQAASRTQKTNATKTAQTATQKTTKNAVKSNPPHPVK